MKNLLSLALLASLFSCGNSNNESKTDYSNITFTMDTVVVDPGNEIINLKNGLWQSDFTEDKKYLYLWNQQEGSLDRINLDQLKLEDKIKFEKEGPDGVGTYVSWVSSLDNERTLMANFKDMGLFDMSGKKVRTYNLEKEKFKGDSLSDGENFIRKIIITEDGNMVYGLLGGWTQDKQYLAKVDFENMELKKFDLPGIDELHDYSIMLKSNQMIMVSAADKSVQKVENKIILSNSAYATLYVLDIETDSVYQAAYSPTMTKSGKKGGYPKEVDSEIQFEQVMADINAEISFRPPVWDPSTKRFYRFSYETFPDDRSNELEEEEKKTISKVYLTVLDENFKLLGETAIPQLQQAPSYIFVKDGKIWYYVNVDDELGFVRLTFES